MTIFSEISHKTSIILRHPWIVVFAGAGLFTHRYVNPLCINGHLLPTLIPKKWAQFAVARLFVV